MKKRLLVFVLPFVIMLSGCFGNPVQDDIVNYINVEMKKAYDLEATAVTAYESVSGANYSDDETMYYKLVDEVIPTYDDFLDELKDADIQTEELEAIHDIYIEGAELQQEAFDIIVEALLAQDVNLINQANTKLDEGRALIEEYTEKLDELAEEHNVEWEE